jgi:DNA-3-methyladenine glycosylase
LIINTKFKKVEVNKLILNKIHCQIFFLCFPIYCYMHKLPKTFYLRDNVLEISRDLLGKYIFTQINNQLTGGLITEVEAYAGVIDRASHTYGYRRTQRNEIMYANGGVAYVYLCYGIHHLFNIVTNVSDIPHAILLRGIKPVQGIETMLQRRNKQKYDKTLTSGPGSVSQALGIKSILNGTDLTGNIIWLEDCECKTDGLRIFAGPRIGVGYAGDDALLPYRFLLKI